MTIQKAQELKDFYDNEYARNPKNDTAKARSELMDDIITKLGE